MREAQASSSLPVAPTGRLRHRQPRLVRSVLLLGVALLAVLALSGAPGAAASQGDRSPEYQQCVESCQKDQCSSNPLWDDGTAHTTHLPFTLRLMRWTCLDDCRYHCTHRVTNDAYDRVRHITEDAKRVVDALAAASMQDGTQGRGGMSTAARSAKYKELVQSRLDELRPVQKEMVQYHGKWVFIRVLGAQEPLSVLFSLLNLSVHVRAVQRLRREVPNQYPLKFIYVLHALVSCNAWIWSAIFHARDKPLTEKMDYFSAAAVILFGFFFSACRLFRFDPAHPHFTLLARVCAGALTLHILYLSIGPFDYSYNMTANVIIGLAHSCLWLYYSVQPGTFPSSPARSSTSTTTAGAGASSASRRDDRPPSALHIGGTNTPPVPVSSNIPPPSSSRRARARLQLIIGLLIAATCLEIFDFPPLFRALDAHSLWHLATVPLAEMWWTWLIDDAKECVNSGSYRGPGLVDPTEDLAPHVIVAFEKARHWASIAAEKAQSGHAASLELTNRLSALLDSQAASSSEREREKARELGARTGGGV